MNNMLTIPDLVSKELKDFFELDDIRFSNDRLLTQLIPDETAMEVHHEETLFWNIATESKKSFYSPMMMWEKNGKRWGGTIPVFLIRREYKTSVWKMFWKGKNTYGVEYSEDHQKMIQAAFNMIQQSLQTEKPEIKN